jgi:hypothetical protein
MGFVDELDKRGELIYGHTLIWWNTRYCISGATEQHLELAAQSHRCGTYRGFNIYEYHSTPFERMTGKQRLEMAFDLHAPCCEGKRLKRRRTLPEIMKDKTVEEAASVRVAGLSPRELLRGWDR